MFTHYKHNIVILMDTIDTDEFSKIIVMIKTNNNNIHAIV